MKQYDATIMINDEDYHFRNFYDTESSTPGVDVFDSNGNFLFEIFGYTLPVLGDEEEYDRNEKEIVKILRNNLNI